MAAARVVGLLVVLALASTAAAQTRLSGPLNVDPALIVEAHETLILDPGSVLTGNGSVLVHGRLELRGEPGSRVHVGVPIVVLGNGSVLLRHTRLADVAGTALELRGGAAQLLDVTFAGNGRGIATDPKNATTLDARRVVLREHAAEALLLLGPANATLSATSFTANGANIVMSPAPGASLLLADSLLATPTRLDASLHVRSTLAAGEAATLRTMNATLDGGDTGVRIEGPGMRYESADDDFLRLRLGVRLDEGEATLVRARFESTPQETQVGPAARLTLTDVRAAPAATLAPAPAPAADLRVPAMAALALALVGGTSLVILLRRRGTRPHAPAAGSTPAPEPPRQVGPLTPVERRVLEDVDAHPGTAQAAIAERLGMTRQALHYHVKKLEARGLLRKDAHGRETRCTLAPGVGDALRDAASVTRGTHADGQEKE